MRKRLFGAFGKRESFGYVEFRNMSSMVGYYLSRILIMCSLDLGRYCAMTYIIEIELPRSGAWFKYFTRVDSLEEAESIKQAAEGNIKARILKNA